MNMKWVKIIVVVMLLLALAEPPYGYYTLLRLAVTITSVIIAYGFYVSDKQFWVWVFGALAVLFNPIVPISFDRTTWNIIDVITAVIYLASYPVVEKYYLGVKKYYNALPQPKKIGTVLIAVIYSGVFVIVFLIILMSI